MKTCSQSEMAFSRLTCDIIASRWPGKWRTSQRLLRVNVPIFNRLIEVIKIGGIIKNVPETKATWVENEEDISDSYENILDVKKWVSKRTQIIEEVISSLMKFLCYKSVLM